MGAKKIAVLVSGGGTNLQALIDAEKKGSFETDDFFEAALRRNFEDL